MRDIYRQKTFNFEHDVREPVVSEEQAVVARNWEEVKTIFSELRKLPENNTDQQLAKFTSAITEAARSGDAHYDLSEMVNFICCNVGGSNSKNHPLMSFAYDMYSKIFFYNRHPEFPLSDDDMLLVKNTVLDLNVFRDYFNQMIASHKNGELVFNFISRSILEGKEFLKRHEA